MSSLIPGLGQHVVSLSWRPVLEFAGAGASEPLGHSFDGLALAKLTEDDHTPRLLLSWELHSVPSVSCC